MFKPLKLWGMMIDSAPHTKHEPYPYLSTLNPRQREAVEALDGPVLVLAGAGTGKTRVLTTRLGHLLNTGRAYPSQILAVTFTNKAAQEMRERVSHMMGGMPVEGWALGTFHALAARQLRKHADLVGLSGNYTILNPDDQVRLLKQLMEAANIDTKKWAPKAMISFIDRWKDSGKTPDMVSMDDAGDVAGGKLPLLYKQYQARLRAVNACDFGDLLLHMITIFKDPKNAEVLADYHRRYKYIMVDEYQDTNVAQYLWLRLLAQGSKNICCVGDDDQSIYGWRGAEVGNILRFEKDFEGAKIIRLEQNYRSTNNILKAAGAVIANNDGRLGKELWSEAGDGDKITVAGLWDGEAEARWVGEQVEQLQRQRNVIASAPSVSSLRRQGSGNPTQDGNPIPHQVRDDNGRVQDGLPRRGDAAPRNDGFSLNQIAVLVRTGFQTREFEERFIQLGVPYQVIGGPRFYERKEIRDALAYLRVIMQPADDLALERIINTPKRGIGNSTVQKMHDYARKHGTNLHDAIMNMTQTDELRGKVKATLMKLLDDFARWRSLVDTTAHPELTAQMLEESGYMQMWQDDKQPDSPGRIENLKELVSGMSHYEDMQQFLEHVALVMENQESAGSEAVSIMTLHGAKGLEFDAVFLPGWEDGLFPSQRSMDESGLKGLEEERRLAYVGITRARKKAFISFVGSRRIYGNWVSSIPSRFVDELPEDLIDAESQSGLYQAGRSSHWDSSGSAPRSASPAPRRNVFDRKVVNEQGATLSRGDRVNHKSFGMGTIINIDGQKLDIKFDKGGTKRIMSNFVEAI